MSRNVVGILGGMGPEATILLQQRLLATVKARDDADHLPLLIDMNLAHRPFDRRYRRRPKPRSR